MAPKKLAGYEPSEEELAAARRTLGQCDSKKKKSTMQAMVNFVQRTNQDGSQDHILQARGPERLQYLEKYMAMQSAKATKGVNIVKRAEHQDDGGGAGGGCGGGGGGGGGLVLCEGSWWWWW